MKKIIEETLIEIHDDFGENPFEWCVNEIEGHVRFYNALKKRIDENIKINRSGKKHSPIPPYKENKVTRVLLEYPVKDRMKNVRRPDISVYKADFELEDKYSNDELEDILDAFIEIKVAWGYNEGHMKGKGIKKDLRFLNMHPEIGHLVYFIGNNYSDQQKEIVDETSCKNQIDMYKDFFDQKTNNGEKIYLVFRDKIVNGNFIEIHNRKG